MKSAMTPGALRRRQWTRLMREIARLHSLEATLRVELGELGAECTRQSDAVQTQCVATERLARELGSAAQRATQMFVRLAAELDVDETVPR